MALVKKIVTGFVIQTFDTDTNKFIDQEFVAGDEITYENRFGENINGEDAMGKVENHYLPMLMKQPRKPKKK